MRALAVGGSLTTSRAMRSLILLSLTLLLAPGCAGSASGRKKATPLRNQTAARGILDQEACNRDEAGFSVCMIARGYWTETDVNFAVPGMFKPGKNTLVTKRYRGGADGAVSAERVREVLDRCTTETNAALVSRRYFGTVREALELAVLPMGVGFVLLPLTLPTAAINQAQIGPTADEAFVPCMAREGLAAQ